jgi:hypothetical protein
MGVLTSRSPSLYCAALLLQRSGLSTGFVGSGRGGTRSTILACAMWCTTSYTASTCASPTRYPPAATPTRRVRGRRDAGCAHRADPPPSVAPETDTVMFSLGPVGARWRPEEPLKRYWQCDIWGPLFDALLNHEGVEPSAALGTARYAQTPRSAPGAYAVDLTGRRGAQGTTGGVFDAAGTPADTHAQGAAAGAGGGAVARAAAGGGDRRVSARARRWAS